VGKGTTRRGKGRELTRAAPSKQLEERSPLTSKPACRRQKTERQTITERSFDMTTVPQSSGHTIYSAHIEEPINEFFVAFDAPAYTNILRFEAGKRWARILAETPEGAVRIARYHHFSGNNFELLPGRPNDLKPE